MVKSKHFFKDKYPLEIYKNLLKNEFSLSISDSLSYIRNKKAYNKSSELNNYFQDAFFIENYMFFEDNGCVVCFTKDNIKSALTKSCFKKSNTAFPYNKKHPINDIKYEILECDIIGIKDFLCGDEKLRYISLPAVKNIDIIIVPMDCGDSPYRFYLLSIHANKVISNLYVEGELYDPESQGNVEVTSFGIDKNYVIQVSTKKNIDNKLQYEEIKKYQINKYGEISSIN